MMDVIANLREKYDLHMEIEGALPEGARNSRKGHTELAFGYNTQQLSE